MYNIKQTTRKLNQIRDSANPRTVRRQDEIHIIKLGTSLVHLLAAWYTYVDLLRNFTSTQPPRLEVCKVEVCKILLTLVYTSNTWHTR